MLAHFNQREGNRLLLAEETYQNELKIVFFLKKNHPSLPTDPLPLLSTSLQTVFQLRLMEEVLFLYLPLISLKCA